MNDPPTHRLDYNELLSALVLWNLHTTTFLDVAINDWAKQDIHDSLRQLLCHGQSRHLLHLFALSGIDALNRPPSNVLSR